MQIIIEDGTKRTLKQFAEEAMKKLEDAPTGDEVCQLADNITELENDRMTAPVISTPYPAATVTAFLALSARCWGS